MINYYFVGQMVKKAREAKRFTQAEVSEMIGISPGFLSQIESGAKNGAFETYINLANTLDVTLDYLTQNVVHRAELNCLNAEFVELFESLPAEERRVVLDVMKSIKQHLDKRNK